MSAYVKALRPIAFRVPPEAAHKGAQKALAWATPWKLAQPYFAAKDDRLATDLGGLPLSNPVGLAAGFDKSGDAVGALQHLGFGYVTVGSILRESRPGNPRPRIFRYPEERSLGNCYGLPSKGVAHVAARLRRVRRSGARIIGNVAGFNIDDILHVYATISPLVDAVEVSCRCPNVVDRGYGDLELYGHAANKVHFERLLKALNERRTQPLYIKFPPYESEQERGERLELIELVASLGVDGITVSGAFARPEPRASIGRVNITGELARARTLALVRDAYRVTKGRVSIKALGGISSGQAAFEAIAAGATTSELLTGLVYEGPSVARKINLGMLDLIQKAGVGSIGELRGSTAG